MVGALLIPVALLTGTEGLDAVGFSASMPVNGMSPPPTISDEVDVSIVAGSLTTTAQSMMDRAVSTVVTAAAAGVTGVTAAAAIFLFLSMGVGVVAPSVVGTASGLVSLPTLLARICSVATAANVSSQTPRCLARVSLFSLSDPLNLSITLTNPRPLSLLDHFGGSLARELSA